VVEIGINGVNKTELSRLQKKNKGGEAMQISLSFFCELGKPQSFSGKKWKRGQYDGLFTARRAGKNSGVIEA